MKPTSPLQFGNLGKSFILILFLLTLVWCVVSLITFGDLVINQVIGVINLVLAAILGWFFYRYRYHYTFSYDGEGFELQRGRERSQHKWKDFSLVSLVHIGGGNFVVRLYKSQDEDADFVDLPASSLRLDPSDLRFEVMGFVKGAPPQPEKPGT